MARRRGFFDFDDPFFKPLWRRVVAVALCLGWALFEFTVGDPFWGTIFGGIGLVAGYFFFIDFKPREDDADATENKD